MTQRAEIERLVERLRDILHNGTPLCVAEAADALSGLIKREEEDAAECERLVADLLHDAANVEFARSKPQVANYLSGREHGTMRKAADALITLTKPATPLVNETNRLQAKSQQSPAPLQSKREEELREALEPFAELGRSEVAEQFTDGTVWILTNGERRFGAISHGALRKAAALNPKTEGE